MVRKGCHCCTAAYAPGRFALLDRGRGDSGPGFSGLVGHGQALAALPKGRAPEGGIPSEPLVTGDRVGPAHPLLLPERRPSAESRLLPTKSVESGQQRFRCQKRRFREAVASHGPRSAPESHRCASRGHPSEEALHRLAERDIPACRYDSVVSERGLRRLSPACVSAIPRGQSRTGWTMPCRRPAA